MILSIPLYSASNIPIISSSFPIIDSVPNYLFIYSLVNARLTTVLELIAPLRQMIWHATIPDHLWFVSSPTTSFVYYWTIEGANVIDIQPLNAPFSCRDIECHPKATNTIMIKDKTRFCVGYMNE